MNELLPCPFCNQPSYPPRVMKRTNNHNYFVICQHCKIEGNEYEDKLDALDYWNTRPGLNPSQDYIRGFNECKRQLIKLSPNIRED